MLLVFTRYKMRGKGARVIAPGVIRIFLTPYGDPLRGADHLVLGRRVTESESEIDAKGDSDEASEKYLGDFHLDPIVQEMLTKNEIREQQDAT